MTLHTHSVADTPALIHPTPPAATTADMVAQAAVAARFLDSLGIRPWSLYVTELGRVECSVDAAGFDRAANRLVADWDGTRHVEGDFLYVEARVDGVPVQVWVSVEERDAWLSAQVDASDTRRDARLRSVGGAS